MTAGVSACAGLTILPWNDAALSALNSGVFASSRMLMALARRGDAPRAFAQLNGRGVPVAAMAFIPDQRAALLFGVISVLVMLCGYRLRRP